MKIKELHLYTSNLQAQTSFYSEVLGLEIVEKEVGFVSFQIGNSILKLSYRENVTPYHYAINIPSNQEKEALTWLKNRVQILKDEESEIQYFDFWNANAVYFYDADKNIVEFIARKNLMIESDEVFDISSLLSISEIGLPTDDIEREFEIVNKTTGMPIFSGSTERFCAVGDEYGLFIMINRQLKKEWYPTKDKPFSSDFEIVFEEQSKVYHFGYYDEVLTHRF